MKLDTTADDAKDTLEPTLEYPRTDKLLPMLTDPNTDIDAPTNWDPETEQPAAIKSEVLDSFAPKQAALLAEILDPILTLPLNERELPIATEPLILAKPATRNRPEEDRPPK